MKALKFETLDRKNNPIAAGEDTNNGCARRGWDRWPIEASMQELIRLTELNIDVLKPLHTQAEQEGFRFLNRLAEEYWSGANRFDKPGEALFGIVSEGQLAAIGGLNRDPYEKDFHVGRVRRVYVAPAHRRQGMGRRLMEAIITEAHSHFVQLVLRTDTAQGASFYEALGFQPVSTLENATHTKTLTGR